ncbi:MAG: outer membrane beta-barrel protein [Acidobacteriaceae bacterium]
MIQRTVFPCALLLALLLGGSVQARAQSPEASTGGEERITVGGDINATYLGYGKRWIGGAGASVDANWNWRLGIEGESNFTVYREFANTHATTYLAGPRYQLNALGSSYRYRPYVKALIGVGQFNFPYNYGHGSYFVVAPGAGVDYRLNYRWRLRLVDFEYQYWPQFSFGATQNYAITTGIRYNIR